MSETNLQGLVRETCIADFVQPRTPRSYIGDQNGSMSLIAFAIILSLPHRKKVLDFYQRACLSGYCSAFAYKPMHCALSSQLNGKCIELVQVPGQSAIFTSCDLPGTTPIKQSSRRNSWSSDGMSLSSSCGMYC